MKLSERGPGQYRLEGTVSAIDAEVIRDEVCSILTREIDAGGPDFSEVFDLGGVEDGNSVLIALMMSWVREAARQDRRISYRGVPRPLYELIEFYGLDEVLPMLDGSDAV